MMVEPMLNISMVHDITQENENYLEKPDTMLQRKLLTNSGYPSKVFLCLKTLLDESMNSTMIQVYTALKEDSVKGDFVNLIIKNLRQLEIIEDDETIEKKGRMNGKNMLISKHRTLKLCPTTTTTTAQTTLRHVLSPPLVDL